MHNTPHTYAPVREPRRWTTGVVIGVGVLAASTGAFVLGRATAPTEPQAQPAAAVVTRDGVPVPNRRTEAGAATAAMTYEIAGFRTGGGTLDATKAAAVLLSPQATEKARAVLKARRKTDDHRTTYAPLSAEVRTYSPDRAEVAVWGVSTSVRLTNQRREGRELWGRAVVSLTWDGAQWRVIDNDYSDGPWPVRADDRMIEGPTDDFSFRANEQPQGWAYVPDE